MPIGNQLDKPTNAPSVSEKNRQVGLKVMTTLAVDKWKSINWPQHQRIVFKLQRRIFKASQIGKVNLVRKLQRLLIHSRSARLLAVRRVSQDNRGKRTAGVDGIHSISASQRFDMAQRLRLKGYQAQPLRQVVIPKGNGRQRHLGIPTLFDRAMQALVKMALEPEWEAKFEPNSYGFRPARSAHDAIQAIFTCISRKPKWVLDADIAQCFDRIDHRALLDKCQLPPGLERPIRQWLQCGVLQQGQFVETQTGTPQGGVISPLLANIALHGMETLLGDRTRYGKVVKGTPTSQLPRLIRYADDLVVLHPRRELVLKAQELLSRWLQPLGLQLHPDKTRITHTRDGSQPGFDFLGFHIQTYPHQGKANGFVTLIHPSRQAKRRHYQILREIVKAHRFRSQARLIARLNPVIRGWCHYYSRANSSKSFRRLTFQMEWLLTRWMKGRHRGRKRLSMYALLGRYYPRRGKLNGRRFQTPQGLALYYHQDTPIRRHVKVKGTRSPFDSDWFYWANRQSHWLVGSRPHRFKLFQRQEGRCAHCRLRFTYSDSGLIDLHHKDHNHRNQTLDNLELLHRHCHHLKLRGSAR